MDCISLLEQTVHLARVQVQVNIPEARPEQTIIKTQIPNLFLIPTSMDLAVVEQEFVNLEKREERLKNEIKKINTNFDYI